MAAYDPEGRVVHVLAIQKGLADLDGIVVRRMERRNEVNDDRAWSETVTEVRTLIGQAGGNPFFPDLWSNPWIPAVETVLAALETEKPKLPESPHVQNDVKQTPDTASVPTKTEATDGNSVDRHAMVKAYIHEVFSKTGKRITRAGIWRAAGYKARTEFERWERSDPKNVNKVANDRFTRLLLIEKPHLKSHSK